jgi:hypothetical protein
MTLQEDIKKLEEIEHRYEEVIEELAEDQQANYGLIQKATRKLCIIKLKRLDLESVGLV